MKRRLRITVLVDWAEIPDDDPQFEATEKTSSTEYHVVGTLRELGHHVTVAGSRDNLVDLVQQIVRSEPDLVFNLTEQFHDRRGHDTHIAAVLELMGMPFTGTGAAGMLLCRDKRLCNQLLRLHRIGVPRFALFPTGHRFHVPRDLQYPLVVKPALGDGSDGISNASLVTSPAALRERVQIVHERWQQPAMAEEYIQGRELYVGVLGNRRLTTLPPRELFFPTTDANGPVIATYRVKFDAEYQTRWQITFGFADLDQTQRAVIARVCKRAFRVLQMRDYGRMDLRLTPEGRVVILEANANPDIAFGEEFAEGAARAGLEYRALLDRIVRSAMRRGGC